MTRRLTTRLRHRSGELTFVPQATQPSTRLLPRYRHALAIAGPLGGLRVADVGCFTGELLGLCSRAGAAALVGIDLDGPWLHEARIAAPNAEIIAVTGLQDLPSAHVAPVDVLFLLETLEHLPRGTEHASLRALYTLVKPGGRLVLSTPAAGVAAVLDPAWLLVGHRHYRRATVTNLLRGVDLHPSAVWYSGDLAESADLALFYLYKHVLRRPYRTPRSFASGGERLTSHRRVDSGTIWADARRPPDPIHLGPSPALGTALPTITGSMSDGAPSSVAGTSVSGQGRGTPSVTVVVPTRNAERTLAACLGSLRSQRERCTVIVVDNHSTDGTLPIASAMADHVLTVGPERSAQRNAGARMATTPVVGFVDADMVLSPDVAAQAVAVLTRPVDTAPVAVIVPERSSGTGFWADVRAFERSFYDGSNTVEAARFFRADAFQAAGGFDETLPPGPEDWDLTNRVRATGAVARIDAWIDHDEGEPTYLELCRKKAYYAPGLRAYIAKYGAGSLSVLDRPYLRRPWLLGSRGWRLGLGVLALKGGEVAAALPGLLARRQAHR